MQRSRPGPRRMRTASLSSWRARTRFAPKIAFETADYAGTATLVSKGFGIALVPQLVWPPASEHAVSCVHVQAGGDPIARQISLAHPPATIYRWSGSS